MLLISTSHHERKKKEREEEKNGVKMPLIQGSEVVSLTNCWVWLVLYTSFSSSVRSLFPTLPTSAEPLPPVAASQPPPTSPTLGQS